MTVDDADMSQARAEAEAPYLIAASRKPSGPLATGNCHYCDAPVAEGRRWCDSECRDLWERSK